MLAFACAFTMFAGAAFTDQADISDVNADAVELLTTLNIIQGDPDGSFAPEREVTRAEMAKMIYTIRNNGNDDASAYETVTTSFTDISGHWAEGYIKYLQNTGIVAGKSATKFDPDSTVTTGEAMKMALVLAGYRADKAELTGTKWLNNTVSLATTVGMTKDVQSAIAGGCTRQDAAQVLYNTLTDVYAVQWSEVTNSFLNDSKQGLAWSGDPITVGNKWMDLTIYVGRMTSSGELTIAGADAGKDRFIVDVDTKDNASWEDVLTFKDGKDHTDLVGMEVKVLTGDKIDEVFGVYATGTSQVVETTMDQVDVESDYDLKVDGTVYDAKGANVYADLSAASTVAKVFTADGEAVADSVKMIDWDNNGKYETILVNTVSSAKVNYVSSTSITLGSVGSRVDGLLKNGEVLEFADNTIAEDLAKNDFAVVTKNVYDDSWNVVKADVVTGTVDGKVDNERKVRVDGTWYTLANAKDQTANTAATLYTVPNSRETFVNKDEITLYVVGGIAYYAESTKGNDVNRSVLMVYDVQDDADQWGKLDQIKVIFPTGDKSTVTLASNSKVTMDGANSTTEINVGQMYYYTTNNDGEYLLTVLADGAEMAGYDKVVNDTDGIDNKNSFGGQTIADEAIVFALVGGDDAKVYSGKAVKDAALTGAKTKVDNGQLGQALQDTDNGFTYTRMMNIDIDENTIDTTTNYGYLLADGTYSYNKDMGCYVMEYEFWNGSEVVNAIEKTSSNKEQSLVKHTIIAYAEDGDYIKDVKVADGLTYASMIGYSNGKVSLLYNAGKPAQVADVDADTITFYVNSDASKSADIGQIGEGWDYVAPNKQINVAYVMDNDKEDVKFIVIDVDGQLSGKGSVGDAGNQGGNQGEPEEVEALPSTSERNINISGTISGARYLNNTLYVQFNNAAFAGASKLSGELKITDSNGASVWKTFEDLGVTEGTQVSKVLAIPYTTTASGALTVSTTTTPAVNEWYVAYVDGTGKALTSDVIANATKTVANKAGEEISFTIKMPTGATEYSVNIADTNSNTAPKDSTYAEGSNASKTADLACVATYTSGAQPKFTITSLTATKYAASITVAGDAIASTDNLLAIRLDAPLTELNASASPANTAAMTASFANDTANGDQLVIYYSINGEAVADPAVVGITTTTNSVAIANSVIQTAVTGRTDIVITKAYQQKKIASIASFADNATATVAATYKVYDKNGELVATEGDSNKFFTVGEEYTVKINVTNIDAAAKLQVVCGTTKDSGSISATGEYSVTFTPAHNTTTIAVTAENV